MPADTKREAAATKPKTSIFKRLIKPALAITLVTTLAATWIVVSVLTAKPGLDRTVHAQAVELARRSQPQPDQASRYGELIEAGRRLNQLIDGIATEVVRDEGYQDVGIDFIDFNTPRIPIRPGDIEPEKHLADADDARRGVAVLLERGYLDDLFEILQSPNLANEYTSAFDDRGDLRPVSEWVFSELSLFRELSVVVVGSARVAAEQGDTEQAASLLEKGAPLVSVTTRQITFVDHLVGYAIGDMIASEAEFLVQHKNLTHAALSRLRGALSSLRSAGELEIAILGESIYSRDHHFRTHTAGGRFIPSVATHSSEALWEPYTGDAPTEINLAMRLKDARAYFLARRDTSLGAITAQYDRLRLASFEEDPVARESMLDAVDDALVSFGPRFPLLDGIHPHITNTVRSSFEFRTRNEALGILLAMSEHRLDSGDWPTTLDQLVPSYLNAIPVNPLTGDLFEYDHEPGEPPSLRRLGIGPEFDD